MNDYFETAQELAKKAGAIMLEYFQIGVASEDKADKTPLTLADTKINALVVETLRARYPDHSIMGEEQSSQAEGAEFVWVCDPIDGTMPFVLGVPTNVFALALIKNGQPILAVVYDPYLKRLYSAEKGKGAFMNDAAISVSQADSLDSSSMGVSGPRDFGFAKSAFVKDLLDHHIRTYNYHSAIYEGMLVASGQFVGHVFAGKTNYDVAVTKLIVEEAGGKVTDIDGNDQQYDKDVNGIIASNGKLHDEILELVNKHLAIET